jgi:putative ABC transport system permease protein
MGLAGSFLGAAVGAVLQRLVPGLLTGLIPVDVSLTTSWSSIALGIVTGLWVTVTFTLLPILGARGISPLAALRRPYETEQSSRDIWWVLAVLALAGSTVGLAVRQVGSFRQGAIFAGGVGLALLILWTASWLLIGAVRRWLPARWPYVWRQGLANLHRPANQTATLVLAIGFGAFLLGTLFLVQHNLLHQLRTSGGPSRPNLVLFDIQPDQLSALERELRNSGLPLIGPTPIVPMRILSVKGQPVRKLLAADSGSVEGPSNAWVFRREYRSTYRDTVVGTERVVEGKWFEARSPPPARISVERDVARELGVGIGDEIVWDVQGVAVTSRVTSIREVDWGRFEPNFFVVFAPGTLEKAPRTFVTLTRITNPADRGRFQRRLAEQFSNLSTLDLSLLQEALERLVDRVALAIRFMALFSLGVGCLVLIGALTTSRFQRMREGALLRALGATRAQLLRVILAEYLSLGLVASAVALALAAIAGWALARFVFEGPFSLPLWPMSALALMIVTLTVIVGLANSRDVIRRTPLQVLRED